jgi:uncharacterized protein (TIGR02284 family)
MAATLEKFKKLHTALIDTSRGYEEAIKDSNGGQLSPLFRELLALHNKDHAELHQVISKTGETPDDSGSFMSTVHRVVIDMRAAITGLDENALSAFISGEESIIGLYDEALEESRSQPDVADILKQQKQSLQAQVAKMKVMQTA